MMVSKDRFGDRVLELNVNYGLDSSVGMNLELTKQTTKADRSRYLDGTSREHGVTVNAGRVGVGVEKVFSEKYTGENYNLSLGLKGKKANKAKKGNMVTGSSKIEHTLAWGLPKMPWD